MAARVAKLYVRGGASAGGFVGCTGQCEGSGVSGAEKCFLRAMTAVAHEGQAGMPGAYCIKKPRKQTTCEVRYDL